MFTSTEKQGEQSKLAVIYFLTFFPFIDKIFSQARRVPRFSKQVSDFKSSETISEIFGQAREFPRF
jgi:hypothetical protein